jgi:uncharacterized YigZ family protein
LDLLEVAAFTISETVINKSRFIGLLYPVQNENEALGQLSAVKKQYRDATHHCYAYMIGQNRGIMRMSDDGEPQGTAGMPIVEVLKQSGLTNILMVCVRYFGGVLLGAGGLTRAYSGCAAQTVRQAKKLAVSSADLYSLVLSYPAWSKLEPYFGQHGVTIENVEYADQVKVSAYEPVGAKIIEKSAMEFSNGSAVCGYIKKITVKTPVNDDKD